jgi:hypothetical protein
LLLAQHLAIKALRREGERAAERSNEAAGLQRKSRDRAEKALFIAGGYARACPTAIHSLLDASYRVRIAKLKTLDKGSDFMFVACRNPASL